jgi:1-aminocyclopropane-1-carboxylate deaminase
MAEFADFTLPDIPIQAVDDPDLEEAGISLSMLRLDLAHPLISGNKWFKLKHNLLQARREGQSTLLSFGGAWSNHLHALAAAGNLYGFSTIGVIRGELPDPLNICLQEAVNAGMHLYAVPRSSYRAKDTELLAELNTRFGSFYLIPEGGGNREGALGCAEIPSLYVHKRFDLVTLACGTGTTLAGVASTSSLPILGFQVLRGQGYLSREVVNLQAQFDLSANCDWRMNDQFHFGGYAKADSKLLSFLAKFESRHGIPLEPVYSAKMLYGIYALSKKRDFFPQNCSILAIHGGGLQGRRGFKL